MNTASSSGRSPGTCAVQAGKSLKKSVEPVDHVVTLVVPPENVRSRHFVVVGKRLAGGVYLDDAVGTWGCIVYRYI